MFKLVSVQEKMRKKKYKNELFKSETFEFEKIITYNF
jgi:hypothetical protein